MKNNLSNALCLIGLLSMVNLNALAQATVTPNLATTPATDYLGWDVTGTNPALRIKHESPLSINFYTNAGAGTFNNQRMTIFDAAASPFAGFVGIGTAAPVSLLHLHQPTAVSLQTQFTNSNTGIAAIDGFFVGIDANGVAELRQQEMLSMDFWTRDLNTTNMAKRMRLHTTGELSIATYLTTTTPPAQLNVDGVGKPLFSTTTWNNAIKVSNNAVILFDADGVTGNKNYFIAHPSNNPVGDTYYGLFTPPSTLKYIYKVYSRMDNAATDTDLGTHQFGTDVYLWPLVSPGDHNLPPLLTNIPPLPAPNNDVWLDNWGLYQCEAFRGATPLTISTTNNEGIVVADNDGIFNSKLLFPNNSNMVLLGNGTWGFIGTTPFGVCPNPIVLPASAGVKLNNFNYYFEDQPTYDGTGNINSVGIGYACGSSLNAKLDVFRDADPVLPPPPSPIVINALNNDQTADGYAYGVKSTVRIACSQYGYGGFFEANGLSPNVNVGVEGYALNSMKNNIGGFFHAVAGLASMYNAGVNARAVGGMNTLSNYGVIGLAIDPLRNANTNVGVYGSAPWSNPGIQSIGVHGFIQYFGPLAGTSNYAVMGDLGLGVPPPCPFPNCPPAFPATNPDYAGYFNGDVGTTTAYWVLSDSTLKENVSDINDPLAVINQLEPKSYTFAQQQNPSMLMPFGTHYGLLSQEVEAILPGLVKNCVHPARYDSLGVETHAAINFKAINYTELIPFLIAAIKEQQQQIANFENMVDELSNPLLAPPSGNDNSGNIDVVLASKTIVLNQNEPNPFRENTTIEYFIPDDANQVMIIFTDAKGNVIKEVEIPEKGKGTLSVYAADLSSGIYTYTIVVDGITVDSKRMLKTK